MYRIAVCDSNVADASELVNRIQQLAAEIELDCKVDRFRTARGLYDEAKTNPYHLIFLETEIGGTGGIELAKRIRFHHEETEFIFVTDKEGYALAAYSVYPIGYLLKRVTRQKLYDPFVRAVKKQGGSEPVFRLHTADGEELFLIRDDILYIEVFGNKLVFHCKRETVESIGTLAATMDALPKDTFYRAHRNYIVNLRHVQKMGHYFFAMTNGEKVTVAKNRYTEAREIFDQYHGG